MIITDKFVLINFPKTGTTFARSAIAAVYGSKNYRISHLLKMFGVGKKGFQEFKFPKLYGDFDSSYFDQHGVYRQIPLQYRNRQIVSIIRNPLYKYISSYVFGFWKKHPPYSLDQVRKDFPAFPELSFSEFYDLINHPNVNEDKITVPEARMLGSYSRMFLVFYTNDPNSAASEIFSGKPLNKIVPEMTFLHQEMLRDNLYLYLTKIGVSDKKAKMIYNINDKNMGSDAEKNKISNDQIQSVSRKILHDEYNFLEAFPEYLEQLNILIETGAVEMLTSGCSEPRKLGAACNR